MLLTDMTQVLVLGGRHVEVIEVAQPTVARGLRRGVFHRYEVLLLTNYIDALVATGEWDAAAALLQDPAIPRRGWRAWTWLLGAQTELFLLRGDDEAARAAMGEYRAQTPASSSSPIVCGWSVERFVSPSPRGTLNGRAMRHGA